jgi:MOSC domain-containing protein YiiM
VPIVSSVNLGSQRAVPGLFNGSAIFTRQILDPVEVNEAGIVGDQKVNMEHHHPDQAVSLYLIDDYMFWRMQLRRPLLPGTFGENFTIDDLKARELAVGDRFTIGDLVLEVTSQRRSCKAFDFVMGDPGWSKRFREAARPGAYCRVIAPGTVKVRDEVVYTPFEGPTITLAELARLEGASFISPKVIERALKAPLHEALRNHFEAKRMVGDMVVAGFPMPG